MYVAVVDVDEPAVVSVDGQRVDIDQFRVEVAQTRPRVGGAGLEPRLGSSGRVNGGRSDQDGLNCVDRVRRHLGVAVGPAAGRWWAGTLRPWPLHERRARRARCLRRREEAVTKRRPARRRQPGARSGGGEMVTASGSMSEDDGDGGALAGGKGAAGMPARSAAVGGGERDAGHARRLARHRRGVMIRVLIVKD